MDFHFPSGAQRNEREVCVERRNVCAPAARGLLSGEAPQQIHQERHFRIGFPADEGEGHEQHDQSYEARHQHDFGVGENQGTHIHSEVGTALFH